MEDGDGERCHSDESGIWARGNQPLVNRFVSGSRCNAVGGNCGETSASMADWVEFTIFETLKGSEFKNLKYSRGFGNDLNYTSQIPIRP